MEYETRNWLDGYQCTERKTNSPYLTEFLNDALAPQQDLRRWNIQLKAALTTSDRAFLMHDGEDGAAINANAHSGR